MGSRRQRGIHHRVGQEDNVGIVMKIDEWVIREVIDTLHQANITLLRITGLDSPQEFAKKCVENETAINRRIRNAIGLLKASVKDE